MEGQEVGIILQFVRIMMKNGIHIMIQIAHQHQKKISAQDLLISYFIEEGIGKNRKFSLFLFKKLLIFNINFINIIKILSLF